MKTRVFITTEKEDLLCVANMLDYTLHEYVKHGMYGQGAYVRTYTVDIPAMTGVTISRMEWLRLRSMQQGYKLKQQEE